MGLRVYELVQNTLERTIAKLNMLNNEVIARNDFGIIYRNKSTGKLGVIKINKDGKVSMTNTPKEFTSFAINNNFIVTGDNVDDYRGIANGLYVAYEDDNLLARYIKDINKSKSDIYYNKSVFYNHEKRLDSMACLLVFHNGKYIVCINHLGEDLLVPRYEHLDKSQLTISGDNTGPYTIYISSISLTGKVLKIQSIFKTDLNFTFLETF